MNGAERKGKSEIIPEKRSLPEQTIDLLFLSLIGEAMRGPELKQRITQVFFAVRSCFFATISFSRYP